MFILIGIDKLGEMVEFPLFLLAAVLYLKKLV